MKKSYLFAGLVLLAASPGFAQTKIGAPGAPDGSAMLEVTSGTANNKGLLLPRMTLTQRNAIPTPATGLMIYNTTSNQVQVNTGTPTVPVWVIATATNSGWDLAGNSGTNPATNFIGTTDNQPLVVRTNNTEKVRVTAAGNMGIGTTSPIEQLHVADTGNASILVSAPSGKQMRVLLGSSNHGIMRNLTSSGGKVNDVALYTSSGNGAAAAGDLYLVANPTVTASDSLPIEQFVLKNTGNVGIGTTTPAQKLHVQGTVRIATAVGTPTTVTGRNAAGDVGNVALGSGLSLTGGVLNTTADNADWNLTGNTGTNPATNFIGTGDAQPLVIRTNNAEKLRVTAAGNVGIGNASPAFTLDVNGSIKANNDVLTASTSGSAMAWNSVNSGLGETELINYRGTGGGGFRFYSIAPGVVPAAGVGELMRITGTGNVGIGTNTPAQSLHVQGTARIATAVGTPTTVTGRNAAGDVGNVTLGSGLSLTGGVLNTTADNADWNLTGNTGTNPTTNFIGTGDAQPLVIRTNNAEKLRVTAAGNVGIGNASPAFTLDVNGSIKANNDVLTASTSGSAMAWNSVNSGQGETELINYKGTGGGGFGFYSIAPGVVPAAGVGELMRITGTGNVGIGTTAPAQSLHVQGTARIATAVGTPTTITGRNAAGDVGNVALGSGLALTGGVLTATPDNTDWNIAGNTGTNPATNFIGTSDNQALAIRTNNTEKVRVTSTGNVGIGTQNPLTKLAVNEGSLSVSNTAVISSSAIDVINNGGGPDYNDDIAIHSYGTTAPAFGMWTARGTASAPLNAQANDYVGVLRFSTQVNGVPTELNRIQSNYLGNGTTQKSRLTFYSNGDGADLTMAIDSSGYVGIGLITPHYKLDVAGDINAWGSVRTNGVALTSDARLKRNIANSSYGLNTVMDLRPVVYDKKNSILETDYNRHEIGFIAQEIAKVLPSIVTEGKDADKTLAVSYTELIPVLTKAIQEQQAQIEALKAKNEQLETVNKATAQLMERVKQMEQMMGIKEIEGTSKVAGK
jgi:hypothetical protein